MGIGDLTKPSICISWWQRILHILSHAYWSYSYFLWRNVCPNPLHIFKLYYLSFYYRSVITMFTYSWYKSFIRHIVCKYFLQFFRLSFFVCLISFLLLSVLWSIKFVFVFCFVNPNDIQLTFFFCLFLQLLLWVSHLSNCCQFKVKQNYACFSLKIFTVSVLIFKSVIHF